MNRLPELLSSTINTFSLPIAILMILLGAICAIAGKQFYWLATGLNAFTAVFILVSILMVWPAWQYLTAAAVAGLLVALITIALKSLSFSLNGFFIFGLLVVFFIVQFLSFDSSSFTPIIIFFVAGSLAAFHNLMKPNKALIYTTAFIGAFAIVCGVFRLLQMAKPLYITILWTVFGIAGSIWQTHREEKRKQEMDIG
jgi:hypothetical protein